METWGEKMKGWMKNKLIVVGLLCLVLISGCVDNEELGERRLLEGDLNINDAETSNYYARPIRFGLLKGHQYTLEHTVEKFTVYVDSEMEMNISFPDEFQIIDGSPDWSGTDKKKINRVTFIPTENGDYLIESQSISLDLFNDPASRGYTETSEISVYVRDDVSELLAAMKLPEADQELPTSKGQILNEARGE